MFTCLKCGSRLYCYYTLNSGNYVGRKYRCKQDGCSDVTFYSKEIFVSREEYLGKVNIEQTEEAPPSGEVNNWFTKQFGLDEDDGGPELDEFSDMVNDDD